MCPPPSPRKIRARSTLIKILAGVHAPDFGSIGIEGSQYARLTPHEAKSLGVQVIFQDLSLFPNLTVLENIAVDHELRASFLPPPIAAMREDAAAALDQLGAKLPLDARVSDLPVAHRQIVAICRGLAAKARILFMEMFRASLPYGRKGLALGALSCVDLALWDAQGLVRGEPVYKLIGGATKKEIPVYCTGPRPDLAKEMGFWGGKVPLPHGPGDGADGLRANRDFLARHRATVGPDFPLMVDCYMALNVPYAIDLAYAIRDLKINWLEECFHPDDFDGHRLLKERAPWMKWTTGEHEYSRYGFRKLIAGRSIDILQPDMMWLGGLTEALRVSAMAAAYDIPVIPHGSGAYSYHFVMAQPHSPFCEYLITSPEADRVAPVFGGLFENEDLPRDGEVRPSDEPGFGLRVRKGPNAVALRRPHPAS